MILKSKKDQSANLIERMTFDGIHTISKSVSGIGVDDRRTSATALGTSLSRPIKIKKHKYKISHIDEF